MANFRAKATGRSAARETIALVHAKPRCYEREDPLGFWTALTGAAVELGLRVDLSDYEDTMMCLREISGRGYRRIGLTSSEDSERHTNGVFVAAYRYFCETQPNVEGCPVLRLTGRNRERMTPEDRAGFEQWFREHRPERDFPSASRPLALAGGFDAAPGHQTGKGLRLAREIIAWFKRYFSKISKICDSMLFSSFRSSFSRLWPFRLNFG